ncbi:unnamed protein product [Adineta steineri]|uniref:Uncharacterized protein n=1 Tax=Adineta steineri TaxID=433720 RepID=A0A819M187_9BILA|nr:unnamed protein product [Adineta steineri]
MAHYHVNGNQNHNNQIPMENYEFELMKLMEQYQSMIAKQQSSKENFVTKPQETEYIDEYTNRQYSNPPPQIRRRAHLHTPIPGHLSPVKPLRIIIIRHAERADAVLGSEWSKKSFDRLGRYTRFSEHLPDALPARSYLHHYVIDVPLTNRGRMHAYKTGRSLLSNGYAADICYTSPSLRCVQSADKILSGMGRKNVAMQLEPGLFECYLNDFKRTLCFMTKDELAVNGYNIDRSYQAVMSFMRPHDSQLDYYERCQAIMDIIIRRHQATGGTILIVAHAPSLEGLTRHFSGGKYLPEKLFDIARRVPFLAMTILERNSLDSPWLFRTLPLQTDRPASMIETEIEQSLPTSVVKPMGHNHSINHQGQPKQVSRHHQQHDPYSSPVQNASQYVRHNQHHQRPQQIENQRYQVSNGGIPVELQKLAKSSTLPDLQTSRSYTEMFHVI